MIKNFNFYDIYGYLIPGVVLIFFFWLPFGLTTGAWPSKEWSSALLILLLGYVVGHMLSTFSIAAFPEQFRIGSNPSLRYPTVVLFDKTDPSLPGEFVMKDEFKRKLAEKIANRFEITAKYEDATGPDKDMDFATIPLLCRSALLQHKAAGYTEQAQGMYALLRNLSAACALAAAFHAGWASAAMVSFHCFLGWITVIALGSAIVFSWIDRSDFRGNGRYLAVVALLLLVFLLGIVMGEGRATTTVSWNFGGGESSTSVESDKVPARVATRTPLQGADSASKGRAFWVLAAGLAALELVLSLRFYTGFRKFAFVFAKSLYRDFYALESYPSATGARELGNSIGDEGADE